MKKILYNILGISIIIFVLFLLVCVWGGLSFFFKTAFGVDIDVENHELSIFHPANFIPMIIVGLCLIAFICEHTGLQGNVGRKSLVEKYSPIRIALNFFHYTVIPFFATYGICTLFLDGKKISMILFPFIYLFLRIITQIFILRAYPSIFPEIRKPKQNLP